MFLSVQSFEETGQLYSESNDFPLEQVHLLAIVSGLQKLSSTLASGSSHPALVHQDSCWSHSICFVTVSWGREGKNRTGGKIRLEEVGREER